MQILLQIILLLPINKRITIIYTLSYNRVFALENSPPIIPLEGWLIIAVLKPSVAK